jgi:hypothetical protein
VIRDGISEIEQLAQQVSNLRQTQQHGQALAKRQQTVDMMLERAIRARRSSEQLSARLDAENSLPITAAPARQEIDSWITSLDADLAAALDGDGFATFNDTVVRALRDLDAHTAGLWQRYVTHHAPDTSAEVLEALANDPRARVAVIRIRRLSDQLKQLRERTVPSTSDIEALDTAAAELHETWATLDVESLDPEVVSFLRAANSERGASVTALSPRVLSWLEERGASDHYVIKPAD